MKDGDHPIRRFRDKWLGRALILTTLVGGHNMYTSGKKLASIADDLHNHHYITKVAQETEYSGQWREIAVYKKEGDHTRHIADIRAPTLFSYGKPTYIPHSRDSVAERIAEKDGAKLALPEKPAVPKGEYLLLLFVFMSIAFLSGL